MFNTLAVARQLAAGGVARDQAEVITRAIHDGLETRLLEHRGTHKEQSADRGEDLQHSGRVHLGD